MLFNKVSPKNNVHTRRHMLSNCNNPAWSFYRDEWNFMEHHEQPVISWPNGTAHSGTHQIGEWKTKSAYYNTSREMFRAEPANADSAQNTWPQGLNSNAQWYQSHSWKLLHKFGEIRLWTVVQLLCTLKDSSNYGHKIHLHRSTCGLFLHYRWIDGFQKQITFRL